MQRDQPWFDEWRQHQLFANHTLPWYIFASPEVFSPEYLNLARRCRRLFISKYLQYEMDLPIFDILRRKLIIVWSLRENTFRDDGRCLVEIKPRDCPTWRHVKATHQYLSGWSKYEPLPSCWANICTVYDVECFGTASAKSSIQLTTTNLATKFKYGCGSGEGWGIGSRHSHNPRRDIADHSWYRSHAIQITMAPCFSTTSYLITSQLITQITNSYDVIWIHINSLHPKL